MALSSLTPMPIARAWRRPRLLWPWRDAPDRPGFKACSALRFASLPCTRARRLPTSSSRRPTTPRSTACFRAANSPASRWSATASPMSRRSPALIPTTISRSPTNRCAATSISRFRRSSPPTGSASSRPARRATSTSSPARPRPRKRARSSSPIRRSKRTRRKTGSRPAAPTMRRCA
jgi:hypothetical protein